MPKVKKDYKYTKTYNEEELAKAIEAINNGMPKKQAAEKFKIPRQTLQAIEAINNGMPKKQAAEKFKIPRQTLQYRLSEKFKKPTHGPAT
ncbi:CENP-B N-terminal DNA-binding domain [Popillia japonica]